MAEKYFAYLCSDGSHYFTSLSEVKTCPGMKRGKPCPNSIRLVGNAGPLSLQTRAVPKPKEDKRTRRQQRLAV